jgi:hypothetical protein
MPQEYHSSKVRAATLEEETRTIIEEARMVLPGIQALFGFQLIAVFNLWYVFPWTERRFIRPGSNPVR